MIFLAQCSIRFLDVSFRGRFVDVKEFVEVFGAEGDGEEEAEKERRKEEHCKDGARASWAAV